MTTVIFTKLVVLFLLEILVSISSSWWSQDPHISIVFERSAYYHCTINKKVEEMTINA